MRFLARERERATHVLLPEVAKIDSVDRDATRLRIEEAQEEVRHRRLPRPARADERDTRARIDSEIESRERRLVRRSVARGDAFESNGDPPMRRRSWVGRIRHRRLALRELEHAPSGRERRGELARCSREGRDGVERGEREKRERRDEHAIERGFVVRRDGQCEDADRRQARDQDRQRVGDPGDERIAASEAQELAIRLANARESVVLAPIGDELRSSAQELDEVGGQLPASGGLAGTDAPRESGGEQRDGNAGEREPDGEHDRGRRQDECRRDDARERDDEGDERRPEPAQVEPLKRVDVADHASHEISSTERVELPWRERLDALVHRGADSPERAERDVVGGEPLEVARQGTREREKSDDDDDRRQRQDRRLLGRARDEVSGCRDERDAESDRESAERERERDTATRELGQREETGHERHAASRAGTTSRPPSSRTIRSASAASSGRCATSTTVRPTRSRSIASATTSALSESRSAVGSSRTTSGASRRNARASASRRRCPVESWRPPSPTTVS